MSEQKHTKPTRIADFPPATDEEIAAYRHGIETGVMESASPNVVASLLARIEQDQAALLHPRTIEKKLSDRQIAEHVGVSNHFVAKHRQSLESTGNIPSSQERTGKDGKTRRIPENETITTAHRIKAKCDEVAAMLIEKNRSYGDSALKPVAIFGRGKASDMIRVRIDDKLSRIRNAPDAFDEDPVQDLLGYLVLLSLALEDEAAGDDEAKERQKARKGNQPGATVESLPHLDDTGKSRDKAGQAVGVSGERQLDPRPDPGHIAGVAEAEAACRKAG